MIRTLSFLFAALLAALVSGAGALADTSSEHVRVTALLEKPLHPGQTVWVAIRQDIEPGWHTYWRNPGDAGLATSLQWDLPKGVSAGAISWPAPEVFRDGTVTDFGYAKEATLLVPLTAASDANIAPAHLTVSYLVCQHMCVPGEAKLDLDLKRSAATNLFAAARKNLPATFTGKAAFSLSSHQLHLDLDAPLFAGADAKAITVFPAVARLVADGAQPKIIVQGSHLIWSAAAAEGATSPKSFEGLVGIAGKGTYAFLASPGAPIAALPASPNKDAMSLWAAMVFAFLGGLILNLMPCVLPVLSMKAFALARAGADYASARREGLVYTAGVMTTFAVMAAVLLTLKAGGTSLGWGFQLQSPAVILLLALLMTALGFNLIGAFELPLGFAGVGDHLAQSGGAKGAFFTGALAVIVASPCTAPFMGAALGFALTQPAWSAALVFLALGLGFAAPFTALSMIPALTALIPKPGLWMNHFKQALSFPLFATAIWLLWVLGQQSGNGAIAVALGLCLVLVLLFWLHQVVRGVVAYLFPVAGVVAIAAGITLVSANAASTAQKTWQSWSPDAVASAEAAGHPVLVDFSAAWCVTCLVNERVALHDPQVEAQLKARGVVTLKADWTNPDPVITAALHKFQRDGVPLYLLYQPNGRVEVLPQLLTPGIVLSALQHPQA